jgi:hypothetical protein
MTATCCLAAILAADVAGYSRLMGAGTRKALSNASTQRRAGGAAAGVGLLYI